MSDFRPALRPGTKIGGYVVLRMLGHGGMGEVYLAKDVTLDRQVALKIIRPDKCHEQTANRFIREMRAMARVDHPNVVNIHFVGNDLGIHYSVMQYVEGQNLAALLDRRDFSLDWGMAGRLISKAGKGLAAVHAKGLVHRDVKPSNIMMSTDRRVLLMDFGLVRSAAQTDLTEFGQVVGTPSFMSPEQCRPHEEVDFRSDVYSLGATFYTLLTGALAFEGPTLTVLQRIAANERPVPIEVRKPSVPKELCRFVEKSMAPDLSDRLQSAKSFVRRLDTILDRFRVEANDPWESVDLSFLSVDSEAKTPEPDIRQHGDRAPGMPDAVPAPVPVAPLIRSRPRRRWLLPAAIVGASLLVLSIWIIAVVAFATHNRTQRAELPAQPESHTGMVRIPAGFVHTGVETDRARAFLSNHFQSSELLERAVSIVVQEPHQRSKVDAFQIDKYEVTNIEYKEFVDATGHPPPADWQGATPPEGKENHPVGHVTYADAEAYALWAGKKLPTLTQWLRAYRGETDDFLPWGDIYVATRTNVSDNPRFDATSPIDATPQDVTQYGVYNMVGNVCEFVRGSVRRQGSTYRVAKGGEFNALGFVYGIAPMQYFYTDHDHDAGLGFRCVIEDAASTDPE